MGKKSSGKSHEETVLGIFTRLFAVVAQTMKEENIKIQEITGVKCVISTHETDYEVELGIQVKKDEGEADA